MKIRQMSALAITCCMLACGDRHDSLDSTEESIEFINGTLKSSTKLIEEHNKAIYAALHEKLLSPDTKFKAAIWEPRALAIQKQISQISSYLQKFPKSQNANGDQLWQKIQEFKDRLLAIDKVLSNEFADEIRSFPKSYDSLTTSETFIRSRLMSLSPAASNAFISQLGTQAKILEKQLAGFCLNRCHFIKGDYVTYAAIIGQSSSVVGTGEEITITAGVGVFKKNVHPFITINGRIIAINEDGVAEYRFNAPLKAGKYSIPAKLQYTDTDGKLLTIEKDIEYTVKKN